MAFLQTVEMGWLDLGFFHWRVPVEQIQAQLPAGWTVDTFEGSAWWGMVPFRMAQVRPGGWPTIFGSTFPELNLRTYARAPDGTSGVVFKRLETARVWVNWMARWQHGLPYARSSLGELGSGTEKGYRVPGARLRWIPKGPVFEAATGTLEHFLTERYNFLVPCKQGWRVGPVEHKPWPLQEMELLQWDAGIFRRSGLDAPTRPPDHVLCSAGVEVVAKPPLVHRMGPV